MLSLKQTMTSLAVVAALGFFPLPLSLQLMHT